MKYMWNLTNLVFGFFFLVQSLFGSIPFWFFLVQSLFGFFFLVQSLFGSFWFLFFGSIPFWFFFLGVKVDI